MFSLNKNEISVSQDGSKVPAYTMERLFLPPPKATGVSALGPLVQLTHHHISKQSYSRLW